METNNTTFNWPLYMSIIDEILEAHSIEQVFRTCAKVSELLNFKRTCIQSRCNDNINILTTENCKGKKCDSCSRGIHYPLGFGYVLKGRRKDPLNSFEKENLERIKEIIAVKYSDSHDNLTDLLTRSTFSALTKDYLTNKKAMVSMLMLDIDHFKSINDTYGHEAGDKVLREFSSTMEKLVRSTDLVARWGGEEFAIFLPGCDKECGAIIAEKIRSAIEDVIVTYDSTDIDITVSIGHSYTDTTDNINLDNFLKTADDALYQAKNNGRNQIISFEHEKQN